MLNALLLRILRRRGALLGLAATALMLAACRSTEPQQTATAVYAQAAAEIEALRASATVVRARMQTTLEYAATRVSLVEEAGGFLRFSLNNMGTDSAFIEREISQLAIVDTPSPAATAAPAYAGTAVPTAIDPPTALPVAASSTQAPPAPSQLPRLEALALASAVGADDCAIDINPAFTPASSEIYVVARAYNVAAGVTISSVWQRQGAEVARFSFQPENAIHGACIWFYIDQSDAAFLVGAWSVEIFVDGFSPASPLAFQIVHG